ncbi:hypothetical protein [Neptuniibacter sp. QD57_21]|uniref:hypothetical protein n=1 Tax=Neptuniibacter sp. QD57_21 TaxID=3398213 RepID=UPI0039F45120
MNKEKLDEVFSEYLSDDLCDALESIEVLPSLSTDKLIGAITSVDLNSRNSIKVRSVEINIGEKVKIKIQNFNLDRTTTLVLSSIALASWLIIELL